jgi:hypothetical protein
MKFYVQVTVVRTTVRKIEATNADEAADRARAAADVVRVLGVTPAWQPEEPSQPEVES